MRLNLRALFRSTEDGKPSEEVSINPHDSRAVNIPINPEDIRGATREDLEKLRFIFGQAEDDYIMGHSVPPITVPAMLPEGWQKEDADRLWTYLFDEHGRKRASIFRKQTPWDRKSHIEVTPRFQLGKDFSLLTQEGIMAWQVIFDGRVIHTTAVYTFFDGNWRSEAKAEKAARREAKEWMRDRYPQWQSPLAYWELP